MKLTLRRLLLWLALPVLLVVLAVWSWTPSREPSWEGRSLSSWLKDLESQNAGELGATGEPKGVTAGRAIQGMGTNCLPFLLRRLDHSHLTPPEQLEIKLKEQLEEYDVKLPWDSTARHREQRWEAAAAAFKALGHQAAPVVPELQRWLCSTNSDHDFLAAWVLSYIHPEGTLALIAASTNRTIPRWRFLVGALEDLAPQHPEVFAAFLSMADHSDPEARAYAAYGLRRSEKETAATLPVFIRLLADPISSVRKNALLSLGNFEGDIRAAEPAVTTLVTDPDPEISKFAKDLLQKIKAQSSAPPTAAPAP